MEIITLTKENLEREHICCAIANNKDCQVLSKKAWLADRLDEGLVFKKGNVRGKCFIEYIPAENAWVPVEAEGYMYIDCLWVSGKYKGQGYSNMLLDECIRDSMEKGRRGLVTLSSDKKRGFLADPGYLAYKGFRTADTAEPYFKLMYLPFDENDDADDHVPGFRQQAKETRVENSGFTLYYTAQCPFTAKYVPVLEQAAAEKGLPLKTIKLESREDARNAPTPFTTYSLFYNGAFLTHEILSVKKFEKIVSAL